MTRERKLYRWYYNHVGSRFYNLLTKWCFLPFGGEGKVRRDLLETMVLRPGEKVLDMCCGAGNFTFVIAEKMGEQSRVTAADLSYGQIRVAQAANRSAGIAFVVADAVNSCFRDCEFDKVVIPHAVHEMPRDMRAAVFGEAKRILAGEGTLVVLEVDNPPSQLLRLFTGFWWFYWLPFNFETPTRRDMFLHGLMEEVKAAGFRNVMKSSLRHGVFQVVQGQK